MLYELGVDFGSRATMEPGPDRYNPTGYFQHREIVSINREMIKAAGGSEEQVPDPVSVSADHVMEAIRACRSSLARRHSPMGMKDPRFCATLRGWYEGGAFEGWDLRVVRVSRSADRIAESSIRHREVGSFCAFDPDRARAMAERLDELAQWHEEGLGVPAEHVVYEDLLSDPHATAERLGDFIGNATPRAVRSASSVVGKRRALIRHYIYKARHPSLVMETTKKTLRMMWVAARGFARTIGQ